MLIFGQEFGASLDAGDWVNIDGELGAGKTVLCKGILRGLGFSGEVNSPSYALVHQYSRPEVRIPVVHADLYRMDDVMELDELGLNDSSDDCITLIEWAKNGAGRLGTSSHRILITKMADDSRKIEIKTI